MFYSYTQNHSYCASYICNKSSTAIHPGGRINGNRLEFHLKDGDTREKALRRWVQVTKGRTFASEEELNAVIARDVQELVNLRVFLSALAKILPDPAGSAGGRKAEFTIIVANTFVPIPLPLYDSNAGGIQILIGSRS